MIHRISFGSYQEFQAKETTKNGHILSWIAVDHPINILIHDNNDQPVKKCLLDNMLITQVPNDNIWQYLSTGIIQGYLSAGMIPTLLPQVARVRPGRPVKTETWAIKTVGARP